MEGVGSVIRGCRLTVVEVLAALPPSLSHADDSHFAMLFETSFSMEVGNNFFTDLKIAVLIFLRQVNDSFPFEPVWL